jgi:membrane protease YdiL (CAAX protease family)
LEWWLRGFGEFVFRNYLYRIIKKRTGQVLSAIITSTLFAILHFNLAGIVSFFGLGIYNCYLYEKYGYRASVMNHFIFNLISVVFIIIFKALNLNYFMVLI